MADLEAVLADVSYLMAMEKSKSTPAARASKKIALPDPSVCSIMTRYLEKRNDLRFETIFNQRIGYSLFKEFCLGLVNEIVPYMKFYEEIRKFEKLETDEERCKLGREIYDTFIMKDLLSQSHSFKKSCVDHVQDKLNQCQKLRQLPIDTYEPYKEEIMEVFVNDLFPRFLMSDKFIRFTQWKNLELNIDLTMNDFGVHRIIGRGGFGEVYGCRKADTGKMYAMKCLDKKRIKMKQGESLALKEKKMLNLVSTGEGSPFIVCMTYAFQSPEKLCFILDLMNGGDLHYHLLQHNVFSEKEVRFYASEIILGLEHMHNRFIVYRDLKPANILLDENGHVRISDLGLACDFSVKRPYACVGTHGYMAPEVLQKGQSYDSSADWFSLGCMLYKLLRGHSPFRHQMTRDKNEIDKMTLTMNVDIPDSMSLEVKSVLEGLLARSVDNRLGCMGTGSVEVKSHSFFKGIDWQQVYQQKYIPPLVPPRGEVNAADAFDIGSFDEEDTKGIKLVEEDQERYKDFPLTVSERWQLEITETVFDAVNQETDRVEQKKRSKLRHHNHSNSSSGGNGHRYSGGGGDSASFDLGFFGTSPTNSNAATQNNIPHNNGTPQRDDDLIVEGEIERLSGPFMQTWQKRFLKLYPNRLEFYSKSKDKKKIDECVTMFAIKEINSKFQKIAKMVNVIVITLKTDHKIYLTSNDKILICQWQEEILNGFKLSNSVLASMNRKVHQMYGACDSNSVPTVPCHSSNQHQSSSSFSAHSHSKSPAISHKIQSDNHLTSLSSSSHCSTKPPPPATSASSLSSNIVHTNATVSTKLYENTSSTVTVTLGDNNNNNDDINTYKK